MKKNELSKWYRDVTLLSLGILVQIYFIACMIVR